MEFWIKLIKVEDTSCEAARECLQGNCTHVASDFWFFEGDPEFLHEGISFKVVGEEALPGYGDLKGSELKGIAIEAFNVDKCFCKLKRRT